MECGFNHLGLFSQCFKRRFEVSPNRWRQQELARSGAEKSPGEMAKADCGLLSSGMCLWKNLKKNGNGNGSWAETPQVRPLPSPEPVL